ncbi:MAG: site-specific integrase, partial [Phycisphaerae bacterium]|nr:site-specific integrase [Phycisphaerae bacterium]
AVLHRAPQRGDLHMPKTPSYRCRVGYAQAIVTLTDSVTKKRRDFWLGEYGTPESRERYHRIIAEWEANGRRLPRPAAEQTDSEHPDQLKLIMLLRSYYRFAKQHHEYGELRSFVAAMRLMKRLFGHTPAAEFGPKKLRMLREEMIRGDASAVPPRKPWARKYINQQVQRIRRIFKWAVAQELVPAAVHQGLSTLEPLKRGRCAARENPKVGPAPVDIVNKVLPLLSKPVRALVELQLLTGARAGELVELRVRDIEIDERSGVWSYRPHEHKNAHREHDRLIYFGPRAQEILRLFLDERETNAFLFSPSEADADRRTELSARRKTPLSCGNRRGTNVEDHPAKKPGDCYTTNSYRRAIEYACERAFPPGGELARQDGETVARWRERLKKARKLDNLNEWRKAHRFHPHQLRHSAGTLIRREFGLEAAQLALGHASAVVTDAVYAERDHDKVIEIMRKFG